MRFAFVPVIIFLPRVTVIIFLLHNFSASRNLDILIFGHWGGGNSGGITVSC